MKKSFIAELIISLTLILLLMTFVSKEDILMPMSPAMIMFILISVLFVVFSALLFREEERDEREALHKLKAARFSYLVGIVLLIGSILVQTFHTENIDPFIIVTLIGMVVAKILARIYNQLNH